MAKVNSKMEIEEKNMNIDENKQIINNDEQKKIEEENNKLKLQLEQMQKMIEMLQNTSNVNNNEDKDILVESLCIGVLNLSVDGDGNGDIYTFNEFGEEQNIPMSDLKKIIKNNKNFTQEGYYYIKDSSFVKSEKLSKYYNSILNKDELLKLLKLNVNEFEQKFINLSECQKRAVVNLLISKKAKDEDVDMNIIYKCGELVADDGNYIINLANLNKTLLRN